LFRTNAVFFACLPACRLQAESKVREAEKVVAEEHALGKTKSRISRPLPSEEAYTNKRVARPVESYPDDAGIFGQLALGENVGQQGSNEAIRVYNIADAKLEPDFDPSSGQPEDASTKAMLVVPLRYPYHGGCRPGNQPGSEEDPGEILLGCIQLLNKEGQERFNASDEEMTSALAAQLSTVLYVHNLSTERDLLRRRSELMGQAVMHLSFPPDLEEKPIRQMDFQKHIPLWYTKLNPRELLTSVLRYLIGLTFSEYATLYLADNTAGDFVCIDAMGIHTVEETNADWLNEACNVAQTGPLYRRERGRGLVSFGASRGGSIQNVHPTPGEEASEEEALTAGFYDDRYDERGNFETGRCMVMPLRSRIGIKVGCAVVRRRPGLRRYNETDETAMQMICTVAGNALKHSMIGDLDPQAVRVCKEVWKDIWSTQAEAPPPLIDFDTARDVRGNRIPVKKTTIADDFEAWRPRRDCYSVVNGSIQNNHCALDQTHGSP